MSENKSARSNIGPRVMFAVLALVLMSVSGVSCSTLNIGIVREASTTKTFVGRLQPPATSAVQEQTALVAFLAAPLENGVLDVRAYMCDGQADGEVLWVRGPAQPSAAGTHVFELTSANGYTFSGTISSTGISGELRGDGTGADADSRAFSAPRAAEGSGIFDLTVDAGGGLSGRSLTGDELTLSKSAETRLSVGDGRPFVGTLTTVDGAQHEFMQMDLSTLSAAELESEGFSGDFALAEGGVQPGTFRAIMLLDGEVFTSFGRLLLPGTGVTGVVPAFGRNSVTLSCAFCRRTI